jgi:hypothetical protein
MTDKQLQDRNIQLCKEWMDWHDSDLPKTERVEKFILRLGAKYELAETTIYYILRKNQDILFADKNWEKLKRICRLKREIASKEKSSKDVADLLEQLRKELEGDRPLIEQHTHITYNWGKDGKRADSGDTLLSPRISVGNSQ